MSDVRTAAQLVDRWVSRLAAMMVDESAGMMVDSWVGPLVVRSAEKKVVQSVGTLAD